MREITFIKDGNQDGNILGYEEIIIIDKRLSRVLHVDNLPHGDNRVSGDVYEYEILAICDGFLTLIEDEGEFCLTAYYKTKQ